MNDDQYSQQEYSIPATADSPAHIVYLLDSSGSMANTLNGTPRIDLLFEAFKEILDRMLDKSYKGGEVYRPRYKIAVITYSDETVDDLTEGGFVDLKAFWDAGLPRITPGGNTNTAGAFTRAYQILQVLQNDPEVYDKCPAPLVCHVTDGKYTTANPQQIVEQVKSLRLKDGPVLVENLFIADNLVPPISDVTKWGGLNPNDVSLLQDRYAATLFHMSSSLPESYAAVMEDEGFSIRSGSKMMYPGQHSSLIKLAFVASGATPFR